VETTRRFEARSWASVAAAMVVSAGAGNSAPEARSAPANHARVKLRWAPLAPRTTKRGNCGRS
jgi:hypothetical protein